ncbi:MAG: ribosome assembly cofactor RimP [Paludibacteraceae bacterium]
MLDKAQIESIINRYLRDTDYELITLSISSQNEILVEIDRLRGVDVDFCADLNRYMVEQLDAAGVDDYAIEVGSVSLTDPFKTKMQYEKNLGHDVEILTGEGKKLRGQLVDVNDDTFAVDVDMLVQVEGKKRRQRVVETLTFRYTDVKYTRYDLKV